MDSELSRLNKLVKRFSPELSARRSFHGVLQVCQTKRRWDAFNLDGQTILYSYDDLSPVFGLTHNWASTGEGVSWGYMPLLAKLNEISLERRDEMRRELQKERDRLDESKSRDRMNKFEGMADESRLIYKELFKDINTSSMDKKKDPRRKFDRSIKYGNSK
jgi:hypothetical protein